MHGDRWTLADLTAALAANLDDAGHARWAAALKASAIREAIREARGYWWDERVSTRHAYSEDTFRYDLPAACEKVVAVWFEPTSDSDPRVQVPSDWWLQEGSELVFVKSFSQYDGQEMYIHYLAFPTTLLTLSVTNGGVASVTTRALTSAGETFITKGVRVGDAVLVNETGYAGNGTYYVDTVDSETQLTLDRAPGTVGTNLDFTVAQYTDVPYNYIMYFAMAWLYEVSARNKPGRDIDELLKLASYYRALAARDLEQKSRMARSMRRY
jgi:hypothetical protein